MARSRTVFSQLLSFLPRSTFNSCVRSHSGDYRVQHFTCYEQFLVMAFAQLTWRESLRDITAALAAVGARRYHLGLRRPVARATLAHANETRPWRIYADLAAHLIAHARALYRHEQLAIDLDNTVYALDSTVIDLCLSLYPWARYRPTDSGFKVHTLLDLRGAIPAAITITAFNVSDVSQLDHLIPEPGAIYLMDRGYLDFKRLYRLQHAGSFFVIRLRNNIRLQTLYSAAVQAPIVADRTVLAAGINSRRTYTDSLRLVRFRNDADDKTLSVMTNLFDEPGLKISDLYRQRWQVELFFKWIKQHLRIKAFYGLSENAVKTQIWIAICTYVLVAITKKELDIGCSMHTMLQILSLTLLEQLPLAQLLSKAPPSEPDTHDANQLILLD